MKRRGASDVSGNGAGLPSNGVKGPYVDPEKPQTHANLQPLYLVSSLCCRSTTETSTSRKLLGAERCIAAAHEYILCKYNC